MGKTYDSAAQFEELFGQMFTGIVSGDGLDALVDEEMVVRFQLRDPDVDLWIDGRERPVTTSFSELDVDPDLTAKLSSDSMHELLLGSLPLGKALLFRKLEVKGSKSRAMKLESVLHAMQAVYPQLAADLLDR